MINNEILTFIKDRRAQGGTKEQITDLLVTHGGWDQKDVDEAFEALDISGFSMPSQINPNIKPPEQTIAPTPSMMETKPMSAVSTHPAISGITTPPGGKVLTPTTEAKPFASSITGSAPIFESPLTKTTPPVIAPISITPPGVIHVATPQTSPSPTLSITPKLEHTPAVNVAPINQPTSQSINQPFSQPIAKPNPSPVNVLTVENSKNQKSLEPTMRASSVPGISIPPQIQNAAVSPIPESMTNSLPKLVVTPAPIDTKSNASLQDLRAQFMEGKIASSPKVTAPNQPIIIPNSSLEQKQPTPALSLGSKGIGFPSSQGSALSNGLSSHIQSGMTPSEKPPVLPQVMSQNSAPAAQTVKTVPPTAQALPVFSQGQKMATSNGGMALSGNFAQRPQLSQMRQAKAPGRKLLGFFMFTTGLICGSVIMHAYLNGYLDPAILVVTNLMGKIPTSGS